MKLLFLILPFLFVGCFSNQPTHEKIKDLQDDKSIMDSLEEELLLNNQTLTEKFNNNSIPLKKVNIFHDNYSCAAEFINKNWENIDNWWNKEETQKARIIFCNKFAKKNKNMIDKLYKIIDEQKKLLIN